jgi:hypothetical protein
MTTAPPDRMFMFRFRQRGIPAERRELRDTMQGCRTVVRPPPPSGLEAEAEAEAEVACETVAIIDAQPVY